MSKKKILIAMLVVFLKLSTVSFAQTQSEMNAEAAANYKKADAELNKVYKQVMAKISTKEKKLLVAAQRNWIKYRDSKCIFDASLYEGGTMYPLAKIQCLETATKARTEDLKSTLNQRDEL